MIRFGKITDLPELKALWKECFADEDAYIDAFFDAMYEDAHVLLEEENGVLAGASFFLPGKIALEDAASKGLRWQEIRYVYALAVYPQYRGRGIAAALLHRAYEAYGAPLIAEPAEEGLIGGFYEPLGFSCNFYLDKTELTLQTEKYDLQAAELSETHMDLLAGSLFTQCAFSEKRLCKLAAAPCGVCGYAASRQRRRGVCAACGRQGRDFALLSGNTGYHCDRNDADGAGVRAVFSASDRETVQQGHGCKEDSNDSPRMPDRYELWAFGCAGVFESDA